MQKDAIKHVQERSNVKSYRAWLQYSEIEEKDLLDEYCALFSSVGVARNTIITNSAIQELTLGVKSMFDAEPSVNFNSLQSASVILGTHYDIRLEDYGISSEIFKKLNDEGFLIKTVYNNGKQQILLIGKTDKGILYATYHLLRIMQCKKPLGSLDIVDEPQNQFRMINQWDNIDGTVERGYSGNSIFYYENEFSDDLDRIKDYARLLSSIGINAISINNVNVWD